MGGDVAPPPTPYLPIPESCHLSEMPRESDVSNVPPSTVVEYRCRVLFVVIVGREKKLEIILAYC